jgi:hypothetical protein
MELGMNVRIRPIFCASIAFAVAFSFSGAAAVAQTAGPDEAVTPDGAVMQPLALTPAQQSNIYDAVHRQRVRFAATVTAAVGAPVAALEALTELPDLAAAGNSSAIFLKYAMVEDDVVVVDPINMRVVDIIHASARP